jgi:hypothetical protein
MGEAKRRKKLDAKLGKPQRRFKKQINPVYQKCIDLGIDLTMYEDIINTSFVPEEIKHAIIHLTLSLRDYPEIIDEIIDTLPQFWILSETRKSLEKLEKQDEFE